MSDEIDWAREVCQRIEAAKNPPTGGVWCPHRRPAGALCP